MSKIYNVLFVCTVNSARSILAESLLNQMGKFRFHAYSAGVSAGIVSPLSLEILRARDLPTAAVRSKSWTEFTGAGAPELDFVFTVCEMPPGEPVPAWPGNPLTADWCLPDPTAVSGSEEVRYQAFRDAFSTLQTRIKLFMGLPIDDLDRATLQRKVDEIGRIGGLDPASDRAS